MANLPKRLGSLALALFMVLSLVPFNAMQVFAAEEDSGNIVIIDNTTTAAATIGTQEYDSLGAAIEAAESGATIVLHKDVDTMPTINKAVAIRGAEGKTINVNAAIAENFPNIEGTVTFENLTFNQRISTESASTDQSKLTLVFDTCTFNIPAGTYAIQGGSTGTTPNDVLGGLKIVDCTFNGDEATYTNNYMVYAQCVLSLTVEASTFNGNGMSKGAIHTGDSIEQPSTIAISGNTISGVARGIQVGNRVTGSSAKIDGNTFANVNTCGSETKSGAIYVHGNANENVTVVINSNTATATATFLYNDGNTAEGDSIAKMVTQFTGNTLDGSALTMDESGDVSVEQTKSTGIFNGGLVNMERAERTFLSVESSNVYATESFVIKVYDAEGILLVTTSLVDTNNELLGKELSSLSTMIGINCTDSYWDTRWEEGKLSANYVPAYGTLYVDGQEMNSADIKMVTTSGEQSVNWADVPGVPAASLAASGTISQGYTVQDSDRSRIYGEITGMSASQSVVIKLYSGDTLLATTTLANEEYLSLETLSYNIVVGGRTSSSWNTVWEEGHPISNVVPNKVVLYIDGTEMNTAVVTMDSKPDDLGVVTDWATLDGVTKAGLSGTGTAEDPFLITDLADLKWFRDDVNAGNSYDDQYIKLTANIDLAGENWTPIGTSTNTFNGCFDGGNHTISNLTISGDKNYVSGGTNDNYKGLFGYMKGGNNAGIKNVTVQNASVTGCLYVGAILGRSYTGGILENCHVVGTIQIDGYSYIGGIVGRHDYSKGANANGDSMAIYNCSVDGVSSSTSYVNADYAVTYVGGIVGFMGEGNYVIDSCSVKNITVSGVYGVGGVTGIGHYGNAITAATVDNVKVVSTGNDTSSARTGNVGLIAGATMGTDAQPTTVKGTVTNTTGSVTYTDGTTAEVTALYGTNINGSNAVTNWVAVVDGTYYESLAEALNACQKGQTVTLLADVDLKGEAWTPVGTSSAPFQGTFDGNGYTISNLVCELDPETTQRAALFGEAKGATIKNVNIHNVKATALARVSAIVGGATNVKIDNCHVTGDISLCGYQYVGAIVGKGYATVTNCSVAGTADNYADFTAPTGTGYGKMYMGGIAGWLGEGNTSVTDCSVKYANLTTDGNVGAITGLAHYGNTVADCTAEYVNITANSAAYRPGTVGLIAGGCAGTEASPTTFTGNTVSDVVATDAGKTVTALYGTDPMGNGTPAVTNLVAEVNGTYYESLADAIAVGGNVTLLTDVEVTGTMVVDKDVVLDLNGKTITNVGGTSNHTFRVAANMTVKDSSEGMTGGINNTAGGYCFIVGYNTPEAGNLTVKSGSFYGSTTVASITYGSVQVEGGYFEVVPYQGSYDYTFNCVDRFYKTGEATVSVKGGTFANFNPFNNAAEGEQTNFCAEGYIAVKNDDGSYGVQEGEYAAIINGEGYLTIADALAAAQDGDEVKILVAGTYSLSTSGKDITITGAVNGVVFDNIGAKNMGGANVTFNNVTLDNLA